MDNELFELEAELKRLRPVAVTLRVATRVQRALSAPRRNYWTWAALPMAAALVGLLFVRESQPVNVAVPTVASAPKPAVATYKPVSAENFLYDHRDEGLVTLADGTTARRYSSSYVDTITWKNPRTQASLRWSVPRTEERIVPVSFQ